MAVVSNLSSILKHYAEKQKSAFIDVREFCAYVKKYAEHHVEEEAALVKYLGDPTQTVIAELAGLTSKHIVHLMENGNKKTVICIAYISQTLAQRYKEISSNESIPFPITSDLPKKFPLNAIEIKQASSFITDNLNEQQLKSPALYILDFSKEIPSLLFPQAVPVKVLVDSAQTKIKKILKKEEFHDYIIKKLRGTNPTKEISIKSFFSHYIDAENTRDIDFEQGDDYYLWNQTLYYLRQDIEKVQDKTIEDINILQSIKISEIYSTYLKQKFQNTQKRQEALRELEVSLAKPPFFYSMNQILKFQDKNGRLLYGCYTEEDLKQFMQRMTQEAESNKLPALLIFKVDSGTRYYVYKNKIIQVVVRLCNEANGSIGKYIEDKWYNCLLNYEKLREMTDAKAFEELLKKLVEQKSPVLHSLLTANFMTVLGLEKEDDETMEGFHLFTDGKLLDYSNLLMLRNHQILANAKARLPFIYTIPLISWIISFINTNRKNKKARKNPVLEDASENQEENSTKKGKPKSKQEIIASKAKSIAQELIPEGSTVDRELDYLEKQWNKMITKEGQQNLTEDVNALIRDYTRRVVNTISAQTFSRERIENLSAALVKTPNMQKIHEEKSLTEYVTLYMLRLLSNQ